MDCTTCQYRELIALPSKHEIIEVLWNMSYNKSPELDVMSAGFIKNF